MKNNEIKNLFATCTNVEAVKAVLLETLPKASEKQYNLLYKEFFTAYEKLQNVHVDMYNRQYKKPSVMTAEQFGTLVKRTLDKCKGVNLVQCGQKLIASGNTKPNKEALKALGYVWNRKTYNWEWFTVSADFVNAKATALA